ncbi:hypothetical protein H0E87_022851 [Populus deltoides]|uniref:SAND domain-containing protein n=1 Tax=Populus deltoides TaxID=3696 RepID=A0A8T2XDL9_POPDE|nr:hypothetical protein H0E87_022851 [Populus deltoides]
MANGAEREMVLLFSEEELREMSGVKRGGDYIEVMCGCTSHRYGDAVGRLRVFINGELEITCECTPGCDEVSMCMLFCLKELNYSLCFDSRTGLLSDLLYNESCMAFVVLIAMVDFDVLRMAAGWGQTRKLTSKGLSCTPMLKLDVVFCVHGHVYATVRLCSIGYPVALAEECGILSDKMTPAAFEKHSGRETARKWKNNVWVIVNGEKVPLVKTVLLKYYNQASKNGNGSHRSHNGRVCHRDEFVRCNKCNKERRFRLRSKEECRIHHDALADANWKCADMPYDKITCDDDEERASRRVYRGCTRSQTCKGCTSCVCFGCEICRFSDCSCQTCTDFTRNAKV